MSKREPKKPMKVWEFYTITILSLLILLIGFFTKNIWYALLSLGMAMYLKPHAKYIPIPKSYLKFMKLEEGTTVEELGKRGPLKK